MRTVPCFLKIQSLAMAFLLLSAGMLAAQPPFGRGGGGPPGGFDRGRGGGSPFGDRGSDRGRGGFDPGEMLKRFDRNGNGTIDMDERDGFAGMMLQRFASANPKIDLSKPIPLSTITEEFQRMRGGGPPSSGSSSSASTSDEPALLVPDFSLDYEPELPPGFGVVSAKFSVKVEERDLKEAEERMRRYDRDRDGKLSRDELRSGRWSDDPLQYDRNKDGVLTASELAVRYANRRVEEEQRQEGESERGGIGWGRGGSDRGGWGGSDGWRRSDGGGEPEPEPKSRFGEAKSFRVEESQREENLPGFLSRVDKNGDGMVMMSEFSSDWSESTLEEFLKWDLNNDGIIVYREWYAANERGVRTGAGSSSPSPSSTPARSGGSASSVEIEWAKKQIAKYDKDGDGQLVASEWEKMLVKPKGADTSGDGVLTVEEYAEFRAKK